VWQKLHKIYGTQGLQFVSLVNDMSNTEVFFPYLKKYDVTFPSLWDRYNYVGRKFGFQGNGILYLVDEYGVIRLVLKGHSIEEMHEMVEKVFLREREGCQAAGQSVLAPYESTDEEKLRNNLRLEPKDLTSRVELANLLTMYRRWGEAQKHYEQVMAAQPNNNEAWIGLGILRVEQGDTQGAIKYFRQALIRNGYQYLVHIMIWSLEHPKIYYAGRVDYGSQRERLTEDFKTELEDERKRFLAQLE
jgi:tetratricopeptide (TPR) repeat protein